MPLAGKQKDDIAGFYVDEPRRLRFELSATMGDVENRELLKHTARLPDVEVPWRVRTMGKVIGPGRRGLVARPGDPKFPFPVALAFG